MQQGRRVYLSDFGELSLEPGDYGRDNLGKWWVCLPTGRRLPLTLHVVVENEDGTITVSPSLMDPVGRYHGHLQAGVWHEVELARSK